MTEEEEDKPTLLFLYRDTESVTICGQFRTGSKEDSAVSSTFMKI